MTACTLGDFLRWRAAAKEMAWAFSEAAARSANPLTRGPAADHQTWGRKPSSRNAVARAGLGRGAKGMVWRVRNREKEKKKIQKKWIFLFLGPPPSPATRAMGVMRPIATPNPRSGGSKQMLTVVYGREIPHVEEDLQSEATRAKNGDPYLCSTLHCGQGRRGASNLLVVAQAGKLNNRSASEDYKGSRYATKSKIKGLSW